MISAGRIRARCAGAIVLSFLCGCPPPAGPRGPVVSSVPREARQIVDVVQANAAQLDQALWSSTISVTARFKDGQGKPHVYNLEGNMLFRKPRDLRIDLRHGLTDRVMGIGSNAEDYWVWVEPEMGSMRWGRHRNAGRACAEKIAVRPDQLAAVLGFGGLPESPGELIGPGRKFGREFDILSYWKASKDGRTLGLDREYFVDRTSPFLVRLVVFYDEFGRRVMSALLDDYRAAWPEGPLVAHSINIAWPQDDGIFTLRAERIEGRTTVSPKAFDRPTQAVLPGGVREIIQIDADCDKTASSSPADR